VTHRVSDFHHPGCLAKFWLNSPRLPVLGSIQIDGVSHNHDIVIERGEVRKRKKKPSKKFREALGHTTLSLEEGIPWKCRRLVVGTVNGALPVMQEVQREANRRKIELLILPTVEAIDILKHNAERTNAILHVTC
jgi:hypothetical protein